MKRLCFIVSTLTSICCPCRIAHSLNSNRCFTALDIQGIKMLINTEKPRFTRANNRVQIYWDIAQGGLDPVGRGSDPCAGIAYILCVRYLKG